MANNMSDYLEAAILNAVLRGISYSTPATVYVALYTTAPTDADVGTEVSGGSYVRVAIAFGAPAAGQVANNAQVNWPVASAGWGTVTYIGIRDALTGGNLLFWGQLTSPRTVNSGDTFSIAASAVTVALD